LCGATVQPYSEKFGDIQKGRIMKAVDVCTKLRDELDAELRNHILEFWMKHAIDRTYGGFYGRVNRFNNPVEHAHKSAILNARILWTFSAAYRMLENTRYRLIADYSYAYIEEKFWDKKYGGVYWNVDGKGIPFDSKKHSYAQAFALYGYSEYFRATGNTSALNRSIDIFSHLEKHAFDRENKGYHEAFDPNWNPLSDAKLSDEEIVVKRSMNTHLHLLEAFANLYRVWPDETLCDRLKMLIELHISPMYDSENHHFFPFFDEEWNVVETIYSYGHDIEASWLLSDAAHMVNDNDLIKSTDTLIAEIAHKMLQEGIDHVHGGVFYQGKNGQVIDTDKHWWVQAEAIVGLYDAWQKTAKDEFLYAAHEIWSYAKDKLIDRKYGEWFFRITREGHAYQNEDKVGPWKCPYHTARACMEILQRTSDIPKARTSKMF
jgi:cellobiose epimerase